MKTSKDAVLIVTAVTVCFCANMVVNAHLNMKAVEAIANQPAPVVYVVEEKPEEELPEETAFEIPEEEVTQLDTEKNLGEFKISHYCACSKCCGKAEDDPWYGITATGTKVQEGRTIAVDPKVIPYGTEVTIRYQDGTEHTYIAEDCGGAIEGNRIDVYMSSHEAARKAGLKQGEVFVKEVAE